MRGVLIFLLGLMSGCQIQKTGQELVKIWADNNLKVQAPKEVIRM